MQVYANDNIKVVLPQNPLAKGSLRIESNNHGATYEMIRNITLLWKRAHIAEDYMVYAKVAKGEKIVWEVVPFPKTSWKITAIWNQIKVLWNVTLGASSLDKATQDQWQKFYVEHQAELQTVLEPVLESNPIGKDAFCAKITIYRQSVHVGNNIRILHDYAPLLGKDNPHLLLMPKNHYPTLHQLPKTDYLEIAEKTQSLVNHYLETKEYNAVYLFIKCGALAGQSQPHLHEHLIPTASKAEALWGKLMVLKKLLFPFLASKLGPELSKVVSFTHAELKPVLSK